MDKQILEISNDGFMLSLDRGFLKIENKIQGIKHNVSLDNILSLIISANDTILSKHIINSLCENGSSIIMCNNKYIPSALIIPYEGHWLTSKRIKSQISCSKPLQKQIWKSIIKEKIYNQAMILAHFYPQNPNIEILKRLSEKTLSGDSTNHEGIAANIYFKALFGKDFIRDREKEDINTLLNYSYTLIRAMVARAITGNGLMPYLGIKHCQQANTMPLVDDLMEPFRPLADKLILEKIQENSLKEITLTPDLKRYLSSILIYPVKTKKGTSSFSKAIIEFASNFVEVIENNKDRLEFPKYIEK